MSANIVEHLRRVEVFGGLTDEETLQIATLCRVQKMGAGQVVFDEGDDGDELIIIMEGCVRVSLITRSSQGAMTPSTINMLYGGQSFGEMVLLGGATRSATVTCVDPCVFLVIKEREFAALCDRNPRIGYKVMRNMASDLSYKLRSSNLLLRGNIRWQAGELGRRPS
ncbi:cyclic nucleotide-binding domain-containing protein [Oscillochloris sp. ZM17-4]|uniref:Crp/Fnr family transcriptional regulator n=1 Tax=Oscillochloris sp. ZM17-4 TaxID=2866714 RepID=UPI001C737AF6|nr:cyclic nucleotide-binding domain-containing protein [Oscillochloris sp. ZM17-4]MBX0327890.1 cyclic nucleotide-binding domain-containing protein [Oscillochloris sp. ZM17-4]